MKPKHFRQRLAQRLAQPSDATMFEERRKEAERAPLWTPYDADTDTGGPDINKPVPLTRNPYKKLRKAT